VVGYDDVATFVHMSVDEDGVTMGFFKTPEET
jgi:hypothetical protein